MKETIWQELQRFIDSIRDEVERRIKILKDAIEDKKGDKK